LRIIPFILLVAVAALVIGYLGMPGLFVIAIILAAGLVSAAILRRRAPNSEKSKG